MDQALKRRYADTKSQPMQNAETGPKDSSYLPYLKNQHIKISSSLNMDQPVAPVASQNASNRKSLTLTQILLLNAVVCGVEVCACSGFTYIPPMLLKAGYTEENMSIILGMGPLLGFFFVPIIGRASDRCRSKYGRRRPFILALAVLIIASLLMIPYGDYFSTAFLGNTPLSKSVSLGILTLSVVLLDFTSQACLTPCEALLSDASKGTDQQDRVFMVYSQMVSLGGFLGYLITAIDWSDTYIGSFFGTQERSVFTLLVIIFLFLLTTTVLVAQEQPLSVAEETEAENLISTEDSANVSVTVGNGGAFESGYESSGSEDGQQSPASYSPGKSGRNGKSLKKKRSLFRNPLRVFLFFISPFLCVGRLRIFTYFYNLLKFIWLNIYDRLPESLRRMLDVPIVLQKLAIADFFSWTALMGFNLFFTDFVGQAVYQGNPNAPENSYLRNRYDEGVRMGSWGLLFHCITSTSYAFFIEGLMKKYGTRQTYLCGMCVFSMSMLGMVIYKHIIFVNLMASMTGFAYATLTTIPFILVTKYHSNKEVYFADTVTPGPHGLPGGQGVATRGIATDMAVLDSSYFLSQVILSAIMGYIVHITGTVTSYILTAGAMGVISCFLVMQIVTSKQEMQRQVYRHRDRRRTINL
ncbi:solute carrier family 45 member 3-like isoform X2 [Mizuhopecten yessoensis]|uniref:solute carrier family 45 member 3-like isoform X2 n=1 Tax=Mizuhopecten yessoensis TaxID=6573 RepID=UPI000B45E9CA|nr:solute carrier family 45 member 3-like isoform X2 [Mizuhopecten yessoensis]